MLLMKLVVCACSEHDNIAVSNRKVTVACELKSSCFSQVSVVFSLRLSALVCCSLKKRGLRVMLIDCVVF